MLIPLDMPIPLVHHRGAPSQQILGVTTCDGTLYGNVIATGYLPLVGVLIFNGPPRKAMVFPVAWFWHYVVVFLCSALIRVLSQVIDSFSITNLSSILPRSNPPPTGNGYGS